MKLLYALERKFGRYAIKGLIRYVIGLELIGVGIEMMGQIVTRGETSLYGRYLSLDVGAILQGEVWRLVTFLVGPGIPMTNFIGVFFFAIMLYFYFYVGRVLESVWGAFRFNLYFISGVLFNIVAAAILYFTWGAPYPEGLTYLNQMMILAYATLFPNEQMLYMAIIPIKMKWLGWFLGGIWVYEILVALSQRYYPVAIARLFAMANFGLFFLVSKNYKQTVNSYRRKVKFRSQVKKGAREGATRHRCAVCGRTEADNPNLEFRFCSKCEGNYEYCSDHLFSHEHVHKN